MITPQSALTDALSSLVLARAGLAVAETNPADEDLAPHRKAVQDAKDRRDALLALGTIDVAQATSDSAAYLAKVDDNLSAAVEKWRVFAEDPDLAMLLYPNTDGGDTGPQNFTSAVAMRDSIREATA